MTDNVNSNNPLYDELHTKGYNSIDSANTSDSVLLYLKNNSKDNKKINITPINNNDTLKFDSQNPTLKINSNNGNASVCLKSNNDVIAELSCDGSTDSLLDVDITGKYDLYINKQLVQSNKSIQELVSIYNSSNKDLTIATIDKDNASPFVDLKLKITDQQITSILSSYKSSGVLPTSTSNISNQIIKKLLSISTITFVDHYTKTVLWDLTNINGNIFNIVGLDFHFNTDATTNLKYAIISLRLLFYVEDYSSVDIVIDSFEKQTVTISDEENINKTFKKINDNLYNFTIKPIYLNNNKKFTNGFAVNTHSINILNFINLSNPLSSYGNEFLNNLKPNILYNLFSTHLNLNSFHINSLLELTGIFNYIIKYKNGKILVNTYFNNYINTPIQADVIIVEEKVIKKPSLLKNSNQIGFTNFYNFDSGILENSFSNCSSSSSYSILSFNLSNVVLPDDVSSFYILTEDSIFSQVNKATYVDTTTVSTKDLKDYSFEELPLFYPDNYEKVIKSIDAIQIIGSNFKLDTSSFQVLIMQNQSGFSLKYIRIINIPTDKNYYINIKYDVPFDSFVNSNNLCIRGPSVSSTNYNFPSISADNTTSNSFTCNTSGVNDVIIGIPFDSKSIILSEGEQSDATPPS